MVDGRVQGHDRRRPVLLAERLQRLQAVGGLDLVDPLGVALALDVGAPDHPDALVGRLHLRHAPWQLAAESGADDREISTLLLTGDRADVAEVLGPRRDELEDVEPVHLRHVQDLRLAREVEPRDRVQGVVVGSDHVPVLGLGERVGVTELVDRGVAGVVGFRDAGVGAEDPVRVDDRDPVLVRLRAERVAGLVVGGRADGRGGDGERRGGGREGDGEAQCAGGDQHGIALFLENSVSTVFKPTPAPK